MYHDVFNRDQDKRVGCASPRPRAECASGARTILGFLYYIFTLLSVERCTDGARVVHGSISVHRYPLLEWSQGAGGDVTLCEVGVEEIRNLAGNVAHRYNSSTIFPPLTLRPGPVKA